MLQGLSRPAHPTVRWTTQDQWHVTLRFLGNVPEGEVEGLTEAVRNAAAGSPPRPVVLGPLTIRLGRRTLAVPVTGMDDLAAAVVAATEAIVADRHARSFRSHLTLARSRGDKRLPPDLAGQALEATWVAEEITLVRSHLGPSGARYETVTAAPLTG